MRKYTILLLCALSMVLLFTIHIKSKAATYSTDSSENITLSAGDEITGGTYSGTIRVEEGTISGGFFNGEVDITRGTINGGTFNGSVHLYGGTINNGTFEGEVYLSQDNRPSRINGGAFNNYVHIEDGYVNNSEGAACVITNGTFNENVSVEAGQISGGVFNSLQVFHTRESMTSIVKDCVIQAEDGQFAIYPAQISTPKAPVVSNVTVKVTSIDISGLTEAVWPAVFSISSDLDNIVGLSHYADSDGSLERTMTIANIRAGDFSRINISFDANGGSGSIPSTFAYTKGGFCFPKNTFTKNRTSFVGWSSTKTGNVEYLDQASVDGASLGDNAQRTFFAVWADGSNSNTYTVIVNNGIGSGRYAKGATVTITANAPTAGKEFKEWTGTDGLTFTSGSKTSSIATFTMPQRTLTLSATYEDVSSSSENPPSGGNGNGEQSGNNDGSGTGNSETSASDAVSETNDSPQQEIPETVDRKQKSTTLSKPKAGKKSFSLTWKKVTSKGIKGYEIQCSTDKSFKKDTTKIVTIKKIKTTKTTIKKLKSKKKYYIRIRTFSKINGKKVYSKWSKVKSVKVK